MAGGRSEIPRAGGGQINLLSLAPSLSSFLNRRLPTLYLLLFPNTNYPSHSQTMNWLKTKMGSHGWDITDDDVKKPNVLFLGPIIAATQELEDFEEYFTVKVYLTTANQSHAN